MVEHPRALGNALQFDWSSINHFGFVSWPKSGHQGGHFLGKTAIDVHIAITLPEGMEGSKTCDLDFFADPCGKKFPQIQLTPAWCATRWLLIPCYPNNWLNKPPSSFVGDYFRSSIPGPLFPSSSSWPYWSWSMTRNSLKLIRLIWLNRVESHFLNNFYDQDFKNNKK